MVPTTIKVADVTADGNAVLSGIRFIHGVIGKTTTLTSAAGVLLYDAATTAGTPTVDISANTADSTNFEKTFSIMFPFPLKHLNGLSVDVTNCTCKVYYS